MRQKINAWVDIAGFVTAIASLVSGIVLWLSPSGGYRGGRGLIVPTVLGLSHHAWNTVHIVTSFAMVALVAVHLILHWCWIKRLPKILSNKKTRPVPMTEKACEA